MLTLQDFLKKLKTIEFHTRMKTREGMAGSYHSAFKGHGMSFSECRAFVDGDDVRYIDWNASARMRSLYVKQFVEERELSVCILLDLGASMDFASISQSKTDAAIEAMSILAYSALHNNDRVCLIIIGTTGCKIIPFTKGPHKTVQFILEALHFNAYSTPCSLCDGLKHAIQILKRKSLVFVISDFHCTKFETPIKQLAHRHDVLPVVISDPMESRLPDLGLCVFEDPVTHETLFCDTSLPETQSMFLQRAINRQKFQDDIFLRAKVSPIRVSTTTNIEIPLMHAFEQRANHV